MTNKVVVLAALLAFACGFPTVSIAQAQDDDAPSLNLWPGFEDGDILESSSYIVDAVAFDGDEDEPGSGIASLQLSIDGQPVGESSVNCDEPPCVMTSSADIAMADYESGPHVVSATATDDAGNQTSDEVGITFDPAPAPTTVNATTSNSTPHLDGPTPGSRFGASIANVGDVNNDGTEDVLYGAPGAASTDSLPGAPGVGAAYLVYGGQATGSTAVLGSAGVVMRSALPGLAAGASVAPAGDVNGDGIPDMLIGAPALGGLGLGRVYVVYGGGLPAQLDLDSLGSHGYVIKEPTGAGGAPGLTGPRFGLGLAGSEAPTGVSVRHES